MWHLRGSRGFARPPPIRRKLGPMNRGAAQRRSGRTPPRRLVGIGVIAAGAVVAVLGWSMWQRSATDQIVGVPPGDSERTGAVSAQPERPVDMNDQHSKARQTMVERHLRARDVADERVLEAMQRIPRHEFVPKDLEDSAYEDRPLPIGAGQTISQPYIVALMTQLANPQPHSRALDIGTGSGYQAAVLSELCERVYSIEIVESLADEAQQRLARLGYDNVQVRAGDGYRGWPQEAPFDVIIVAAAPEHVPQPLIDQLAPGGRMVIPVGKHYQELTIVEKDAEGTTRQWTEAPVAFVPMTGEARRSRSDD
jgi:protein-L-isoaspartate(D-aspartate) O-methyltransferase